MTSLLKFVCACTQEKVLETSFHDKVAFYESCNPNYRPFRFYVCWEICKFTPSRSECLSVFPQEKSVHQGEALAKQLKASQEKDLSEASAQHAQELQVLQGQADKVTQDLKTSTDKTLELEKLVSELLPYKEKAQVSICRMNGFGSTNVWPCETIFVLEVLTASWIASGLKDT